MPKLKTKEEAYDDCLTQGFIQEKELIEKDRVRTILEFAEELEKTAEDIKKGISKKSLRWSIVFTMHYDALHELAEALILLDKKRIANHQCLFAYICMKHKELEFDWDFFEKARTRRNGILYYGSLTNYFAWKQLETQFKIYISTLRKAVKEKLES